MCIRDSYLAVLSWGTRQVEVASSTGGQRWSATTTNNDLDGLEVNDCLNSESDRVIVGQNGDGAPVVAISDDNDRWEITSLAEVGAAFGIAEIRDELFVVGWTESDLGSDGAIWRREPSGQWQQLTNTGLESDEFSESISISDLTESDGVVVAIGSDQGRAGVWIASTEALS